MARTTANKLHLLFVDFYIISFWNKLYTWFSEIENFCKYLAVFIRYTRVIDWLKTYQDSTVKDRRPLAADHASTWSLTIPRWPYTPLLLPCMSLPTLKSLRVTRCVSSRFMEPSTVPKVTCSDSRLLRTVSDVTFENLYSPVAYDAYQIKNKITLFNYK